MLKFLKNNAIRIFKILLVVVIAANISDWFFNYSSEINHILNTAMFSLIGIAYLTFSWAFDKTVLKIIFALCGIYLIAMNFLSDYDWISIVGIVCLLVPMIIGKFLPDDEEEEDLKEEGVVL
ncbi:hypothetical protein [Rhodohalobacter sp.]|uniref:hypothetical protein n=1 Tax=Rhodohalobacter sp. TaxID=1974210 RepID=UPI002ACDC870|nr:hypothetical protein [Rhodohalobacter sp.]MDZ7755992.1 hypothetical protein [Rhodohalobacter sp.]